MFRGVPLDWEPPVEGAPYWAVSVREPWVTAVLDGGCDVINRRWHELPHLIDKARMLIDHPLLLHAGGKFNHQEVRHMYSLTGRKVLAGQTEPSCIVGLLRLRSVELLTESPWWEAGRVALVVGEPLRFDLPIPCRGEPGFWQPDVLVQERVRRQLAFQRRMAQ